MPCSYDHRRSLLTVFVAICGLSVTAPVSVAQKTVSPSVAADYAEAKNWQQLATLVGGGTDLNSSQPDGMTALHWSVSHGHEASVQQLLSANADSNAKTQYEVTPLHIACETGNGRIVSLLLEAKADANQTLPGGETPLMAAARSGAADCLQALLKHGAKIDAKERRGQTALMWAAASGNVAAVDTLITAEADMSVSTARGFTAMTFAARDGHIDVVESLVDAGVDVNYAMQPKQTNGRNPRKGTSALNLAVESGHFELAMSLVSHGADPNDQRSGFTPLHALTWVRKPNRGEDPNGDPPPRGSGNLTSLQFVKQIVAAGADVNVQLARGKSGKAVLSRKGATPFLLAGKTADLPYLRLLLELGADPTITNVDGCNAIMASAGVGVRAVGEEAGTESEVIEVIEFLLTLGLNINTIDNNKETAMHGAAYRNFPVLVEFLSNRGADPSLWNHKNKPGWTPVMIAEGNRPGSFKPSPVTVAALKKAMTKSTLPTKAQ